MKLGRCVTGEAHFKKALRWHGMFCACGRSFFTLHYRSLMSVWPHYQVYWFEQGFDGEFKSRIKKKKKKGVNF